MWKQLIDRKQKALLSLDNYQMETKSTFKKQNRKKTYIGDLSVKKRKMKEFLSVKNMKLSPRIYQLMDNL